MIELGADPHSILGAHEADGGVVVRAYRPEAKAVRVQPPGRRREAEGSERASGRRCCPKAKLPLAYELEVEYADGNTYTVRDPYAFLPTLGELDLHLADGGAARGSVRRGSARTSARSTASPERRSPSGRRMRARSSVVGDFNSWDGRLHPMRSLGSSGHLGALRPRHRRGHEVQVRDPHAGQPAAHQGRPGRVLRGGAARERVGRAPVAPRVGGRGVARAPGEERRAARADVDLRGASRLVAAQPARRTTARSTTSSSPTSSPTTSPISASRTSS